MRQNNPSLTTTSVVSLSPSVRFFECGKFVYKFKLFLKPSLFGLMPLRSLLWLNNRPTTETSSSCAFFQSARRETSFSLHFRMDNFVPLCPPVRIDMLLLQTSLSVGKRMLHVAKIASRCCTRLRVGMVCCSKLVVFKSVFCSPTLLSPFIGCCCCCCCCCAAGKFFGSVECGYETHPHRFKPVLYAKYSLI